MTLDDHDLELL